MPKTPRRRSDSRASRGRRGPPDGGAGHGRRGRSDGGAARGAASAPAPDRAPRDRAADHLSDARRPAQGRADRGRAGRVRPARQAPHGQPAQPAHGHPSQGREAPAQRARPGGRSLAQRLARRAARVAMGRGSRTSTSGRAAPLPRAPRAQAGSSFRALVLSVSKDIPVRSVLDEWVRQGIVEHDASDVVPPARRVLRRGGGLRGQRPGSSVATCATAAAGVHNLLREGEPFFDRSVFYDRLSAESIEELRRAASEVGARSLRRDEPPRARAAATRRVAARGGSIAPWTWGAFFFGAPYERDEGTSQDRTPTTDAGGPGRGCDLRRLGRSDEA
ncbi:MAG: DUF6502 family protein [Myxococcota bacterium]